ncbi:MAG TPA: SDR family NAD(P)-dependent oxidoreductase [Phenylobacterium sp.]|nr:SDR family NAD(P)-dependent oxidoreductase [Phenylobacterium sp.]
MTAQSTPSPDGGSVVVAGVGALRGLGAALARRFADGGYAVVIAGRNAEKLRATETALQASGLNVTAEVGDISIAADAQRFVAAAEAQGPLAAAIHNAGSNRPSPFLDLSAEVFESHWREHALGGFQLAQAALPALLRTGGSLLFTGASGSLRGKANFAPFASAKGALRNLAQSLAREFGPQGVHVGHVIIDGAIEGDRLLTRLPNLKDERGPDGMLDIDAIAEAFWGLHRQGRSAWTLELDLRPWREPF